MIIVLFYQKGIMGEKEFSLSGIVKKIKGLKEKRLLRQRKNPDFKEVR